MADREKQTGQRSQKMWGTAVPEERSNTEGNEGGRREPVQPLTPDDLAGEDPADKPSQAEGSRQTVEEDLVIQEERQKRGDRQET